MQLISFTTKKILILFLFVVFMGASLTACGKKGPLYLPGDAEKKSLSQNI